jgi:HEAT repeat protein
MHTAVDVLGEVGDIRAVKPLIDVLKKWRVEETGAALVLSKLTGEKYSQDPDQWLAWWNEQENSQL